MLAFGVVVLLGLGGYFYMQQQTLEQTDDAMESATTTEEERPISAGNTAPAPSGGSGAGAPVSQKPAPKSESVDDIAANAITSGDSEATDTAAEDEEAALLDAEADAAADFADSYDENSF